MSGAGPRGAPGASPAGGLGLAFGWHALRFEQLLDLVQRAEACGFRAVFVDGDVSQLASRGEGDVLDGWTVTTALLSRTERIEIGSIRLVHHWHAARLAQAVATLERIAPGRLRLLVSVGAQPADARFGLPLLPARERIAWLDETLQVSRALWRGETVSFAGRFVRLDGARVRPIPPTGRPPVWVAGRGARLLEVLARHGDGWDVNLPPLPEPVHRAAAALARACRRLGRDPGSIPRSLWIFARPGRDPGDPALLAEYRRWNPWFADVPDERVPEAVLAGTPERCRQRIDALRQDLGISLPVADLSGLGHDAARRALETLARAAENSR